MTETMSRPFTAAAFNQFVSEHLLMGIRCTTCESVYIPPRAICPHCHSAQLEWVQLSGEGKLSAFTSIYIAPSFMIEQGFGRDKPYLTGVVMLDEGPQISARILGLDATQPHLDWINQSLTVDFITRDDGDETRVDLAFRIS